MRCHQAQAETTRLHAGRDGLGHDDDLRHELTQALSRNGEDLATAALSAENREMPTGLPQLAELCGLDIPQIHEVLRSSILKLHTNTRSMTVQHLVLPLEDINHHSRRSVSAPCQKQLTMADS